MPRSSNTALAEDRIAAPPPPSLQVVVPRDGGPGGTSHAPPVSNARVAVAMFLVAESMFFAGLIGAYLVFRVGSVVWPPPGLPALPLAITWLNTILLFASGVTMVWALRGIRRNDQRALRRGLMWTTVLGAVFVAIQGSEWIQLLGHGLTASSGPYGSTFYTLIGTHAAHVVGAMGWVGYVAWMTHRGRYSARAHDGVEVCAVYWLYVCGLWGVLFGLVYH
jgi:heme/copper-type cytochrome/quinol oxidase subunit 3